MSIHLQAPAQVARPRLAVVDRQHAAQPPLAAIFGVGGNLSRLQDDQVLVIGEKVENRRFLLPYRIFAQGERGPMRSEEHTSELQSHLNIVCRLLLEKK